MSTLRGDTLVRPSGVIPTDSKISTSSTTSSRKRIAVSFFVSVVFLAHLPLILLQFLELSYHPQYRFFPVVLAGAALLALPVIRRPRIGQPGPIGINCLLFAASWGLLAVAGVLGSPWLGVISSLVSCATCLIAFGGLSLFRQTLPAWAFLWLTVSPPMGVDDWLIGVLRDVTSRASSGVLDLLGIFHLVSGNVIEVRGRHLFVDEACSGIHSFFALVPVTIFYVLWARRPFSWSMALVAAAAGWALIANIARVVGVTIATTQWDQDITKGWEHELFGLSVYAIALGLLVSTDRLLCFLTVDLRTWHFDEPPSDDLLEPVHQPLPMRTVGRWTGSLIMLSFIPLGVMNAAYSWIKLDRLQSENSPVRIRQLDAAALPEVYRDWKRQDYNMERRNRSHPAGEFSQIWRYRAGLREAIVSLDYPFRGWHELSVCYRTQGWEYGERTIQPLRDGAHFVRAKIRRPVDVEATLMFAVFDAAGQPLDPDPVTYSDETLVERVQRRFATSWLTASRDPRRMHANTYQLQMCVTGDEPVREEDWDELHDFFRYVVTALPVSKLSTEGAVP